jgi:hypothetical protein
MIRGWRALDVYPVLGILDLSGDGMLEIVVNGTYCEGDDQRVPGRGQRYSRVIDDELWGVAFGSLKSGGTA